MKIDVRYSDKGNLVPVLASEDDEVYAYGLIDIASEIGCLKNPGKLALKKLIFDAVDAQRLCDEFYEFRNPRWH